MSGGAVEPSATDTTQPPERPHRLRVPLWAGTAALGVAALTVVASVMGSRTFAPPQVCTAIGYSSVLTVTIDGDASEVAVVQVVDGEQWQPPLLPDAEAPAIPTSRDEGTWTFTLFYPPNPIMLRALDDDGDVLGRTDVDVGCVRVGGSAECGGPMEAEVRWVL